MSAKKSQRQMRVTVLLSPAVASLLATLDEKGDVKAVIYELIDHAQQGVYRSGAWEREWLKQVFGDDFTDRLEPGDPYGRLGLNHIFDRPKKEAK